MVDEDAVLERDAPVFPPEAISLEDGRWYDVTALEPQSVWTAVLDRVGAVIVTTQPFRLLLETFAERFTVRRLLTGEFIVLNAASPVILAFIMANATPAMAGRMAAGLDRIWAPTPEGAIVDSRPAADDFVSVVHPGEGAFAYASDPLLIDSTDLPAEGWRRRNCHFQPHEDVAAQLGDIPEMDADFTARFERYERRLCLRTTAADNAEYLRSPYTLAVEEAILATARDCGFWDANLFPRFAAGAVILGLEDLRQADMFVCDQDQHIGYKLPFLSLMEGNIELHRRQVDRFGRDYEVQRGAPEQDL